MCWHFFYFFNAESTVHENKDKVNKQAQDIADVEDKWTVKKYTR